MNCKNCNAELREEERYCYNCGQKNSQGRLTTKAFLQESWQEFLRFDKRFFRTFGTLLIPGKLTNEIIAGKRARYIKPLRLYIGLSILMIASINIYLENPLDTDTTEFESVSLTMGEQVKIQSKSFDQLVKDKFAKEILLEHNQNLIENQLVHEVQAEKLDSTTQSFIEAKDLAIIDNMELIQYDFKTNEIVNIYVAMDDISAMDRKDLYEKYEITNWFNKKLLTQNIRFIKQGSNFLLFLMQKVGICILIMIPFLALFLKLFYVRSTFYYSEHLSFSLHTHSFLYLLISLQMGISFIVKDLNQLIPAITLSVFPLYLFLSLKLVYKQNFFKTLIKFVIINAAYLLLAAVFIVLLAFLSFLLF